MTGPCCTWSRRSRSAAAAVINNRGGAVGMGNRRLLAVRTWNGAHSTVTVVRLIKIADDPHLWLEDIDGDDVLSWVRARNETTVAQLGDARFELMRAEALEVLDTDTRIPYVRRRGEFLYNFWRDAANPRGLWRRTTLEGYRSAAGDWDVIIDLDELARNDGENWVWAGADVIEPDHTRALISLSRGGSDATVVREFDMGTRDFVADGFELPEAKSRVSWEDHDTVLVGTDFGPGSLTDSGYPRVLKRWRRGQPLAEATTLFSGSPTDVAVSGGVDRTPGYERTLVYRAIDFFNDEVYQLRAGELIRIDAPTDASLSVHREWLLIELRTDYYRGSGTYPAGSLLAADYERFLDGTADLSVVFSPDAHSCLHQYAWTRDRLVLVTLTDVASKTEVVTPGTWHREAVRGVGDAEAFASKVTQQLSELPSFFFGLARSRFIEKNKCRLDHEGTGQFDDSCLSGRNLANFAIGDIAQPDQADDAIGFGIDVHLRSPKAPAVTDFAGNTNVVAHRERRKQFEALKRAGKTHTSALMRWFLGDVFVIKDDLPTSERLKPSDRVE